MFSFTFDTACWIFLISSSREVISVWREDSLFYRSSLEHFSEGLSIWAYFLWIWSWSLIWSRRAIACSAEEISRSLSWSSSCSVVESYRAKNSSTFPSSKSVRDYLSIFGSAVWAISMNFYKVDRSGLCYNYIKSSWFLAAHSFLHSSVLPIQLRAVLFCSAKFISFIFSTSIALYKALSWCRILSFSVLSCLHSLSFTFCLLRVDLWISWAVLNCWHCSSTLVSKDSKEEPVTMSYLRGAILACYFWSWRCWLWRRLSN